MWFGFVAVFVCGVAVDRLVMWDKDKAITREREYHIGTISNLEKQLQMTKLDNYALKRERGDSVDVRDYVYENPDFEAEFIQNGRAKTTLRRRQVRQGA